MKFKDKELNEEQVVSVQFMKSGGDTKIQAPPGSGKTFVLEAGASEMGEQEGLYIAFNKAIADEAGTKFPSKVDCRTGHSLAFRGEGYKYKHRLKKINGSLLMSMMDIGDPGILPTLSNKAYLILDTVRNFCYSDMSEVSTWHVPKLKIVEDFARIEETKRDIVKYAELAWNKMKDVNDDIPITHDVYMKVWALNKPVLNKDYILFDEAQDANPVMLGVVLSQPSQKIFVGDKFQQIYGWRGAQNAMSSIKTEHSAYITQSFRFGNDIAKMANDILHSYMAPNDRPPLMRGLETKESQVTTIPLNLEMTDCIICRTNGGVVAQVFRCLHEDIPIYVQGGVAQMISLLKGAEDLRNGRRSYVADLALFRSWEEVEEYSNSESGKDMKVLIKLIDTYGTQTLINALYKTCQSKHDAKITVTTAHKSKGLEWGTVKLNDDFLLPEPGTMMRQEEINILYVSATRALDVLDISECPACLPEILKLHEPFTHG